MGKKPDADPGKGGHQHWIRQERIKTAGEAKGFRSIIERSTGTGRESIDIVLLGQDLKIACEVSVLTTIDHEIGNARKCLSSGFENIFRITADDCRRTKMAAEVDAYLALGDRGKVRYFSPDEFFAYLESTPDFKPDPASPSSKTIQGWKVKRKFSPLTPDEHAAKTKAAFDLLGQEMKRPKEQE